jgi:hypothetical protein
MYNSTHSETQDFLFNGRSSSLYESGTWRPFMMSDTYAMTCWEGKLKIYE